MSPPTTDPVLDGCWRTPADSNQRVHVGTGGDHAHVTLPLGRRGEGALHDGSVEPGFASSVV